jgi:glycosyltransferase involved in cell wall biosynthesis
MPGTPKASVIIPVYNGEKTLPATLASLARLEDPNFEVILVDDGSTDRSAELIRRHGFKLVRLRENRGAGTARNVGARVAEGDILAFTDADCIVPPDWLARIRRMLAEHDVIAVSGPYSGPHERTFASLFHFYLLCVKEATRQVLIRSCTSSNLACRKDAFWSVGGFPIFGLGHRPDRPFQGHEDSNWGYLASHKVGKVIVWDPDNRIEHQFRTGVTGYLRNQWFFSEIVAISYCKFPMMFFSHSNFMKWSTLAKIAAVVAALPLFVSAIVWHFGPLDRLPPALSAVAFALLLTAGIAVMDHRLFRIILGKERSLSFSVKSLGLLVATHCVWICGCLSGLLKATRACFRFPDIRDLPPYEVQ